MMNKKNQSIEKDFKVFYQADFEEPPEPSHRSRVTSQVNTSQKATDILEGMVLKEKTLDLLALLTAHARGNAHVVLVVPWLPTPTLPYPSATEAIEKKRKEKWGNRLGRRVLRKGRDLHPLNSPLSKEPSSERVGKSSKGEQ